MDAVMSFATRLGQLEVSMAKHAGVCDERYAQIASYMNDSKDERKDLRQLVRNVGGFIIILLLGIIAFFLVKFGLPGAGHL